MILLRDIIRACFKERTGEVQRAINMAKEMPTPEPTIKRHPRPHYFITFFLADAPCPRDIYRRFHVSEFLLATSSVELQERA